MEYQIHAINISVLYKVKFLLLTERLKLWKEYSTEVFACYWDFNVAIVWIYKSNECILVALVVFTSYDVLGKILLIMLMPSFKNMLNKMEGN